MKAKSTSYSYATSPNAIRFGFAKTGCFTVEIQDGSNPPEAVAGFKTVAEAHKFASALPHKWSMWSTRKNDFPALA